MTDYTQGIGAEVDALCALFGRLADKDAFSKDSPDMYKDTGMQVLVQKPEPDKDTHILFFRFGTPDGHLLRVTVDLKRMSKAYMNDLLQSVLLELFEARAKVSHFSPELALPPGVKNPLTNAVGSTLH